MNSKKKCAHNNEFPSLNGSTLYTGTTELYSMQRISEYRILNFCTDFAQLNNYTGVECVCVCRCKEKLNGNQLIYSLLLLSLRVCRSNRQQMYGILRIVLGQIAAQLFSYPTDLQKLMRVTRTAIGDDDELIHFDVI